MAEITEFREISAKIYFKTIFKILLNIFKLLFLKFSNFGGRRNHRISRNFAEILNTDHPTCICLLFAGYWFMHRNGNAMDTDSDGNDCMDKKESCDENF